MITKRSIFSWTKVLSLLTLYWNLFNKHFFVSEQHQTIIATSMLNIFTIRYSDFLNWLSWYSDIKHTRHWQWEKVPSCSLQTGGARSWCRWNVVSVVKVVARKPLRYCICWKHNCQILPGSFFRLIKLN